ncbi:hypothetical protein LXL04_018814 [Taraxacum kok-saghyz]
MVHPAPSMAKQLRFSDHTTEVPKRNYDQLNIDSILESLFAVSDYGLIDASFDGLVKSRSSDSHQDDFIQCALHLGSVILEAGKRSARKRSSVHNASVWPLPPHLTIKVFSMLDTTSVWSATATCLFFQKCAKDPFCYTNIDLAALVPKMRPKIIVPKINARVSTMIEQAGNALQSIKLCGPYYDEVATQEEMLPICSCLSSLSANGGAPGSRLKRLRLYNIGVPDGWGDATFVTKKISASLTVCPSLVEIKIVSTDVHISRILKSVSRYCRLLECFIFEYAGGSPDLLEASVCKEFVFNCPKITTLALQGRQVFPSEAFELVKGFHENLGTEGGANSLEVMIIRRFYSRLAKVHVKKLMKALLAGKFRRLRHLDISDSTCLYNDDDSDDDIHYYDISFIPIKKLMKQRPNFRLVYKYNGSYTDTSS